MEFEIEFGGIEIEIKGIRGILTIAGLVLVGAAVVTELMKPPNQRRWHGKVAGAVPYDFRPPTWQRLKGNMWNPKDPHVMKDKAFGVGWDVNFGALARKTGLVS